MRKQAGTHRRMAAMVGFRAAALLLAMAGAASAQSQTETIVLSVTPHAVRWAAVYRNPHPPSYDPYFHVVVFEKEKGTRPWEYALLAPHLVVTPQALAASRTKKKARTYSYKDVEFRYLYRQWLRDPAMRGKSPVCTTDIQHCLKPPS